MIETPANDEMVFGEQPQKFGVIVADPPWRFSDNLKYEKRDSVVRGVNLMYPTLNLTEIKKLPVNELAAENALCALWVPSAFLKAGIDVLEAWGFEYKQLWIWGKTSKRIPYIWLSAWGASQEIVMSLAWSESRESIQSILRIGPNEICSCIQLCDTPRSQNRSRLV